MALAFGPIFRNTSLEKTDQHNLGGGVWIWKNMLEGGLGSLNIRYNNVVHESRPPCINIGYRGFGL